MLALDCPARFDQATAEAVENVRSRLFGDVTPNLHPVASLSATSIAVSAPLLWTATPEQPAAEATVIVPLLFRRLESLPSRTKPPAMPAVEVAVKSAISTFCAADCAMLEMTTAFPPALAGTTPFALM